MPTSPGTDLIPARKRTKRALASVKGRDSYDALIAELLRAVPPERLRERLDFRQREEENLARARAREPKRRALKRERSPEKQVAIARAAERTRAWWTARGIVTRLGDRRARWDPEKMEETVLKEDVRVVRKPGSRDAIDAEGP